MKRTQLWLATKPPVAALKLHPYPPEKSRTRRLRKELSRQSHLTRQRSRSDMGRIKAILQSPSCYTCTSVRRLRTIPTGSQLSSQLLHPVISRQSLGWPAAGAGFSVFRDN